MFIILHSKLIVSHSTFIIVHVPSYCSWRHNLTITHNSWSHIHSLLIITNRSFTKTRTSHINHILHKTCDSHKRTKTRKLEEIKLTYLETSKFKDFAHGYLNSLLIASKFWLTTINNHISWMMNNLWLMNNLVDLPPIHGRLWLHYSTSISFPKALKFNNEYIIQLYCWSFTKSTTSIDFRSIQTPLATNVEIVLYAIATQKNRGWKCVTIAFKRN